MAAILGLGAATCDPGPKPSVFAALCQRGRPDREADIMFVSLPKNVSPYRLFRRVIPMERRCCPNWKTLAHNGKWCTSFAVFDNPVGNNQAFPIRLGRRATDDDRDVVLTFLRKFGSAHAT